MIYPVLNISRLITHPAVLLFITACSTPPDGIISFRTIEMEREARGVVELAEGISIPRVNSGYTLWLPEEHEINGMVVFFHARRDTVNPDPIIELAGRFGLATVYLTTDNPLEFLFEQTRMAQLEADLHAILVSHGIPQDNLLFCGMSLEGVRALKMAMFAQTDASRYNLVPRAVAVCDAPVDMARFYRACRRAALQDYHPAAANEGFWVANYLYDNLGGSPEDTIGAYIEYAPFTFETADGGNAGYFSRIVFRAYTEPDIQWWMENRGKDYYGMNALDLAAMVNQLKLMGNERAELITTTGKGYHPDGTRHPHSWSIVDEAELIDWFASLYQ